MPNSAAFHPTTEIPLSRPDITDAEVELVVETLRSGRLSIGPRLEQFEELVAARAERLYGIGVSSGTSGLHLALDALGIGEGDEVITTPFSFIASANVILYVGAKPVFVDICPKSLNMDPTGLEAAITPRTRAIIAVETFGNPQHMREYEAIAKRHEIPLIEDCCEALGAVHNARPAGSFGRIGVFAFYPNKQITTGEGGCIVTSDKRLASLCRSLRNQGRFVADGPPQLGPAAGIGGVGSGAPIGSWLTHERLGYNYRMSELSAALGVAQMRRLDEIIEARQRVAASYMRRLMGNPHLVLPTIDPHTAMSWFVFVVRLDSSFTREERDRIIQGLRRHEIGANDYFPCIHLQPFYRADFGFKPGMFPIAETVSHRTIALPFHNRLTEKEIGIVCETLEHMIERECLKRS
ncbi:MAG: DegT/DnrJ/EryC1/StrS family aminotransferase [Phycisphaerales bacterium]|nr:DegT/DnrJ/EryC1/StrS family aminotransferase [Phycisphaerales bacterium]